MATQRLMCLIASLPVLAICVELQDSQKKFLGQTVAATTSIPLQTNYPYFFYTGSV